jgi:photosystem II stability/assembly factor-like uncharacterized protein
MANTVVLSVGTKKGLFLLKSDASRDSWQVAGPFLNGYEVNHGMIEPSSCTLYATANNPWFGTHVAVSQDFGATWSEQHGAPKFPEDVGRSVERLWHLEPGRPSQPGVLYCGVDPGCLFRSDDGGATWAENDALNNHPTRSMWGPGAGGLIVHSVVLDPADPDRMWVAISAAGVFRSEDGGASWQATNSSLKNVLAKYEPAAELYPEAGQCVHHMVRAAGDVNRLYAQTHYGTYRSDDGATTWTEITEGLPSDFGFLMAAHPRDPDTAFVLPLQGAEFRVPPEGKLRVYRTTDAGRTWEAMTKGLPQKDAYMGTYREAMCTDGFDEAGVYFGTNTGQVYGSADNGETWRRITADLPPVSSVSAAVLD